MNASSKCELLNRLELEAILRFGQGLVRPGLLEVELRQVARSPVSNGKTCRKGKDGWLSVESCG